MHPLAQFPGPWYLAISRLPITWQLLSGKQPHWAHKLHQVYGPIVRVAPGQLSFSDGRAWQDINASTKYAKYGMEKDERLNELVGGAALNPDPNMSPQAQTHTQMRRAFAPGLTKSALRQQERIIHGHVDELISELRGLAQDRAAAVSMVRLFNFLSYNVISDLFLGESLNLFKSTAYHSWLDSLGGFARATVAMGALQHFFIARHVLAFVIRHFGEKSRQQFMAPCFDLFDQRLKRESERPDLVTLATREKSSTRESLPLDDMRAFSPFLILAGGETTPTGLSGLFYLLLRNKKKLDRLTREIRGAFESDKDMNIAKLHQLRYLTVCIEEGLRVYPPVPAGFERVVPSSGAPIAGHFVPGGTVVVIPALSTFLSGQNFASPDEFAPERWMENKEDRFSTDCATAFKPFSVGPHACFGQEYVEQFLSLVDSR